jgi:hypothetical protein
VLAECVQAFILVAEDEAQYGLYLADFQRLVCDIVVGLYSIVVVLCVKHIHHHQKRQMQHIRHQQIHLYRPTDFVAVDKLQHRLARIEDLLVVFAGKLCVLLALQQNVLPLLLVDSVAVFRLFDNFDFTVR